MSPGNRYIGFALGALVLAACGSSNETADCDPIAAKLVSRIEVTPSTATLADGESVQLTAVALFLRREPGRDSEHSPGRARTRRRSR